MIATLSVEEAQSLVDTYGSIDAAAPYADMPVGKFRKWCRANGVAARRRLVVGNDDLISREDMLDQEVRELRLQVKRLSRQAVRDERVLELAATILPTITPKYAPKPRDRRRKPTMTPHDAVLLWGDVHAAEVITADESGGLNVYDWDEMLRRHDRMTDSILSFLDHRPYEIPRLHIAGLGDFLSGEIHDLDQTNSAPILEATLQFGLDMAAWVASLIPHFEEIRMTAVHGNHGRTTIRPTTKRTAENNYDWLALEIMKLRLAAHPSVTVEVSRSPHAIMPVLNRRFLVTHGDGIPKSALAKRVSELEKTFAAAGRIDHFLFGHFHEAQALQQNRIFVNGSVVGPSGYSVKNYGGGALAQQTLLLVHPVRGITEVLPLDLQVTP